MQCSRDTFDTEVPIDSSGQLVRIAKKVREAVDSGVLGYNDFHSGRELVGRLSFLAIDPDTSSPDVARYFFECPKCGKRYAMAVETYHGVGGRWSRI